MWEVQPCVARGADASTGWASVAQILRCNTSVEGCRDDLGLPTEEPFPIDRSRLLQTAEWFAGGETLTKQFAKSRLETARCAAAATTLQETSAAPFALSLPSLPDRCRVTAGATPPAFTSRNRTRYRDRKGRTGQPLPSRNRPRRWPTPCRRCPQ